MEIFNERRSCIVSSPASVRRCSKQRSDCKRYHEIQDKFVSKNNAMRHSNEVTIQLASVCTCATCILPNVTFYSAGYERHYNGIRLRCNDLYL